MPKLRCFVSGPFTGDTVANVKAACFAGDRLLDLGMAPFIPHTMALWDTHSPKTYETWMSLCFSWLSVCDAVLRIPGYSAGADREVEYAFQMGIPVFHNLEDLAAWQSRQVMFTGVL